MPIDSDKPLILPNDPNRRVETIWKDLTNRIRRGVEAYVQHTTRVTISDSRFGAGRSVVHIVGDSLHSTQGEGGIQ